MLNQLEAETRVKLNFLDQIAKFLGFAGMCPEDSKCGVEDFGYI